jgi:hypothetical protein
MLTLGYRSPAREPQAALEELIVIDRRRCDDGPFSLHGRSYHIDNARFLHCATSSTAVDDCWW